jgi:hypothetical protein
VGVSSPNPSLWFNPNAFTASVYQYGNSPRDPLVGAPTRVFNLALMKDFHMPFKEQQTLQFRAEAFDAFNHPDYANPDSNLGDALSGRLPAPSRTTGSTGSEW